MKLFWINESQVVTELDSSFPGLETAIARKNTVYQFFHSEEEAQDCLKELQTEALRKKDLEVGEKGLHGSIGHKYSHSYEIDYEIKSKIEETSKLPSNINELLEHHERKILSDQRYPAGAVIGERPPDEQPPYQFELI